jgi:hypothetical protein
MKTFVLIFLILSAWLGYKNYTLSGQNTRLELSLKDAQASLKKTEASLRDAQESLKDVRLKLEAAEKMLAEAGSAASQGDTQYQVIKKEYVEGALVDSGEKEPDTGRAVMKRLSPHWRLYLVGVQTKREYPAFEVQETAYAHFIQGSVYTRLELNSANR